jgi:hypothetical protein
MAMPGPLMPGMACPRFKRPAALGNALWVAPAAPQFGRFAEVPAAPPLRQVFLGQGQMTEPDRRAPVERNQNPAKPSGLLYGIVTLVISSSKPSGRVA